MYVVMIGRPGSGKGTQAKRLAVHLDAQHLATGDLLRDAGQEDSPRGRQIAELQARGDFVPDETVWQLLQERLRSTSGNVIFDGFPRHLAQAKLLDGLLAESGDRVDPAINLEVSGEECTRRLLGRAALEGRADDTPETIGHRMEVYAELTEPLVEYYRQQGVLRTLDGSGEEDVVFERIKQSIDAARAP